MFIVKKISKSFQKDFWKKESFILKELSFSLEKGEIVGFLGANGAGKTTLLKILLGFISATEGEIIFSPEMEDKGSVFCNIGYMPERPFYYKDLTGREFIHYCGKLQDMSVNEIKKKSHDLVRKLKIENALDQKINSYSKGMLQRLGFVSALIHNPKLIILDEPLSGLDPIGRKEFKEMLLWLKKEGCTIFFSSHIISDVEEICEKVVILEKGSLVYQGTIEKLLNDNIKQEVEFIINNNKELKLDNYKNNYSTSEYIFITINRAEQMDLIKYLMEMKVEIHSIIPKKLSLEEVVYNLRE